MCNGTGAGVLLLLFMNRLVECLTDKKGQLGQSPEDHRRVRENVLGFPGIILSLSLLLEKETAIAIVLSWLVILYFHLYIHFSHSRHDAFFI